MITKNSPFSFNYKKLQKRVLLRNSYKIITSVKSYLKKRILRLRSDPRVFKHRIWIQPLGTCKIRNSHRCSLEIISMNISLKLNHERAKLLLLIRMKINRIQSTRKKRIRIKSDLLKKTDLDPIKINPNQNFFSIPIEN